MIKKEPYVGMPIILAEYEDIRENRVDIIPQAVQTDSPQKETATEAENIQTAEAVSPGELPFIAEETMETQESEGLRAQMEQVNTSQISKPSQTQMQQSQMPSQNVQKTAFCNGCAPQIMPVLTQQQAPQTAPQMQFPMMSQRPVQQSPQTQQQQMQQPQRTPQPQQMSQPQPQQMSQPPRTPQTPQPQSQQMSQPQMTGQMPPPAMQRPQQNMPNQQPMMVAMAYVPWQRWQQPFTPEIALEKGTIFPDLDLPFSGYRKGGRR